MHRLLLTITFLALGCLNMLTGGRIDFGSQMSAQELNATIKIIHSQIQGTNVSVFESLETAISEFMNNRAWTDLQFQKEERIECNMTITVKKYDESTGQFTCEMMFQCIRPVFNSNYSTVVFSMRDTSFDFLYKESEPLEFNPNNLDNNLTAMLAYYAYLFIGLDLDTFSMKGGTDVLHIVENIVNSAQSIGGAGWKAYDDTKNRHAIINDYMDSSMEPLRELMYKYSRLGLDEMANNADRGRAVISECMELLKEAHSNKPLSQLPQIFTDYKRDELVNIYSGHGTEKERQTAYDILSNINASQNTYWKKITK